MSGGDKGVQLDYDGISDLPQFAVTGFQVFDAKNLSRDRPYSVLEARFYFDRHFGYFLMNFYVPCTLIVLLCWVAFWTNRESTGDRMGMGITSVLTMVLIANDSKSDSPKRTMPSNIFSVLLLLCLVALFTSTAADEDSHRFLFRKQWYGPPMVCYMFVRTENKKDQHRECFEYEANCKDKYATPNATIPIDSEYCSNDYKFMKYASKQWETILDDLKAKKEPVNRFLKKM